jgi:hypothetical protein
MYGDLCYKKWYQLQTYGVPDRTQMLEELRSSKSITPYRIPHQSTSLWSNIIILSLVLGSVTNNNAFWIRWLDLLAPCTINSYLQATQHYRWFTQFTVNCYALGFSIFTSSILVTELKQGQSLQITMKSPSRFLFNHHGLQARPNLSILGFYDIWPHCCSFGTSELNCSKQVKVKVKVMLRPTVSRPVSLGIKHPSGA